MWTLKLNDVPLAVNNQAVCINDKIYSFDIILPRKDRIDVYIFDPPSCRWRMLKTLPQAGSGALRFPDFAVIAYGDCAYMCAGSVHPLLGCLGGSLYRFDTNTMTWSCPEVCGDEPRCICRSLCVLGHHMCVFGCQPVGSSQHIHLLDLDTYKWQLVETTGDAPIYPRLNSTCAIGSRIYVWDDTTYSNSMYYLDTVTSTWVRPHVEGVAPEYRLSYKVFVYKGEMFIFGGYNRQLCILFADLHKYNPESSRWTQVTPKRSGPCARLLHGCCVIGDRVFVFGGRRSRTTRGSHPTQADRELVSPNFAAEEPLTDLHVLDFAPTLQTLCLAAVADFRLPIDYLPHVMREEIRAMAAEDRVLDL